MAVNQFVESFSPGLAGSSTREAFCRRCRLWRLCLVAIAGGCQPCCCLVSLLFARV